jgi:hypothetical protein
LESCGGSGNARHDPRKGVPGSNPTPGGKKTKSSSGRANLIWRGKKKSSRGSAKFQPIHKGSRGSTNILKDSRGSVETPKDSRGSENPEKAQGGVQI